MTANQTSSSQRHNEADEEYETIVNGIVRDANNMGRTIAGFWEHLPESMPDETKAQLTNMWYITEFAGGQS